MNNASYVIALYIRLSIEDNKVDSLSIENRCTSTLMPCRISRI